MAYNTAIVEFPLLTPCNPGRDRAPRVDIDKVTDAAGAARMELTMNGKWLQYKKF